MGKKKLGKKKRLGKAQKSRRPAPFWAVIKKYGKRRTSRWRLNAHKRRNWRKHKLKKG